MPKHTINMTSTGYVEIDLGLNERKLRFKGRDKLEAISVDVGISGARVCLNRTFNKNVLVDIIELKDCQASDVAELIFDLIKIGRPEKLYLDHYGAGMVVKDSLYPMLKEQGYLVSREGVMMYTLDEMYARL